MKNFKYIKSGHEDIEGNEIFSGQIVSVHGRINMRDQVEVYFYPDYGFRIQGNNFADAYYIKIEKDITMLQKIIGAIVFMWWSMFK